MPRLAKSHWARLMEMRKGAGLGGGTRKPDDRASAAKRGYGRMWRRLRGMQLAREPLCRECQAMGKTTPAREVDHIVPLATGGTNEAANLQSLCRLHHSQKTGRQSGAFGPGKGIAGQNL